MKLMEVIMEPVEVVVELEDAMIEPLELFWHSWMQDHCTYKGTAIWYYVSGCKHCG